MDSDAAGASYAYVDESELRVPCGSGMYLLAGTVVAADQLEAMRGSIEVLRLGNQRKPRWHDENDVRRMLGTKTIATLPLLHVVVVHGKTGERSERSRRLCLRRLLSELDMSGIAQVTLERRQRRQDDADVQLLSCLRTAKAVGSGLRMQHAAGSDEPLLWLPDFVAGAAGAAFRGETRYLDQLTDLVKVIEA